VSAAAAAGREIWLQVPAFGRNGGFYNAE